MVVRARAERRKQAATGRSAQASNSFMPHGGCDAVWYLWYKHIHIDFVPFSIKSTATTHAERVISDNDSADL